VTPERSRRERTAAVGLALAAGVLGFLATSRTWVTADLDDVLAGQLHLSLDGAKVAPVVPAVSLVLLAAGAAVLLARRLGRAVAGLVLVVAGATGAAAAVSAARAPGAAVSAELAQATGRSSGLQAVVATTAWPWLAVLAGALGVVAGVLVVLGTRRWAAPSDRFEVPAGVADPGSSGSAQSAGPAQPTGPASSADRPAPAGPAGAADPGDAGRSDPEPADVWDALNRGDDLTR
jgi:uncharacterized membrane protein (TIGR02234 family)